ncbi:MAG: hypothetical protein WKI04_17825 [Ferruginibacter sp.]
MIFKDGPVPEGRIIISPDGTYFPFEALVTKKEGKHIEYLLHKNAVSYTYSSRYLLNKFNESATPGSPDFLGIAPSITHVIGNLPHWKAATIR